MTERKRKKWTEDACMVVIEIDSVLTSIDFCCVGRNAATIFIARSPKMSYNTGSLSISV